MNGCDTCLKRDKCDEHKKRLRYTTARIIERESGDLSILGEIELLGRQIEDFKKLAGEDINDVTENQ